MSLAIKQRLASTKKLNLPQITQTQQSMDIPSQAPAAGLDHSSPQPCPPEVMFHHYSPAEGCEVPLALRNKAPHLLNITLESSPYFQLGGPKDVCPKVPPGLYTTVCVLFTPGQNKDYFHQLLCITEREEFIVQICATGA